MMPETPVVVLAAADRDRADLYTSWLDGECEVRTAHDGPGAVDAIDGSVDVAVIVSPGSGLRGDEVLSAVRAQEAGIRVAVLRERDADLGSLTRAPDEVLSAPVSPETLRRTVSVLAAERAYDRGIRDLFSLAVERAERESEGPSAPRDGASGGEERLGALRERLDGTLDLLVDEAGFDAVYRALGEGDDRDDRDDRGA